MELTDYKVRVLSGEHGTQARVRVLVDSKDPVCNWGTVGVSVNIIEASWQALVDSITYKLMKEDKKKLAEERASQKLAENSTPRQRKSYER